MNKNIKRYLNILSTIKVDTAVKSNIFTINSLIYSNYSNIKIQESELRKIITWGINKGYLDIIGNNKEGEPLLKFSDKEPNLNECDKVMISVTPPPGSFFGIEKVISENRFITTTEAFKSIIDSGNKIIRISSPFLQKNVSYENNFFDIEHILLSALSRGCTFKILSREVQNKRAYDLTWLITLVKENGFSNQLEIYDYHKEDNNGIIEYSTHAKLIISDFYKAYIGSGELRFNSLNKNFEVGILLEGPSVYGLIEIFDLITDYSKRVY